MSTLIKNATVISVDAQGSVFDPGAIFIEGTQIVDVGKNPEVLHRQPHADRVVDGTGKVVIPGFVSVHNHVGYTVFRGRTEDAGYGCVTGQYFPMAGLIERDERRVLGSLGFVELLASGVTTVLEMEEDVEVYAPFVEQLGIRAAMGVMIHDVVVDGLHRDEYKFDAQLREAELRRAIGFAESWDGRADGRIRAMMTPNMTISSSPEQLKEMRLAADRMGLRLSIHLGSGPREVATTQRLYGKSPFAYAKEHGLLGPDVVVAHCSLIEESDLLLLARSGAAVAHCPLINAMRGHIAPLMGFLERQITVGLAIDNVFSDFFDVLRACVLMARVREGDARVMPATQVLELATMGGARALGLDREIGSLEVGKRADIVVVNYRTSGLTPMLEPVQNLVYHAHGRNVEMVFVDGEILVADGRVTRVDGPSLVSRAQEAATAAWARFVKEYGGYMALET